MISVYFAKFSAYVYEIPRSFSAVVQILARSSRLDWENVFTKYTMSVRIFLLCVSFAQAFGPNKRSNHKDCVSTRLREQVTRVGVCMCRIFDGMAELFPWKCRAFFPHQGEIHAPTTSRKFFLSQIILE